MIQSVVTLVLFAALVAGVIWVVVREVMRGSRRRRQDQARWEAELRQDVATDPRFWHSDSAIRQNASAAGWTRDPTADP
jgi:hypothetical protein